VLGFSSRSGDEADGWQADPKVVIASLEAKASSSVRLGAFRLVGLVVATPASTKTRTDETATVACAELEPA